MKKTKMKLTYVLQYAVPAGAGQQIGKIAVEAGKLSEARLLAKERIKHLCGEPPKWLRMISAA
jgi:hypothetical protein